MRAARRIPRRLRRSRVRSRFALNANGDRGAGHASPGCSERPRDRDRVVSMKIHEISAIGPKALDTRRPCDQPAGTPARDRAHRLRRRHREASRARGRVSGGSSIPREAGRFTNASSARRPRVVIETTFPPSVVRSAKVSRTSRRAPHAGSCAQLVCRQAAEQHRLDRADCECAGRAPAGTASASRDPATIRRAALILRAIRQRNAASRSSRRIPAWSSCRTRG